jgi:AbrB family looped-hinge helix DNA binding protein
MDVSRITSKGQVTIPKRIREAAGLATGDVLAFTVAGDHVEFRKVDMDDPGALDGTLEEWSSREDEEAWRGL